jgi:glycosyltransferase involved in cell wall biosynthesis
LGLEAAGPVLLMAAHSLTEQRKGAAIVKEALLRCDARPLTLLTMGTGRPEMSVPGLEVVPLGRLDDDRGLALAYSAADLLVHGALADNLPNVIMEALACGTPAVGFRVGGVPELIRPGQTGWLADTTRAEALAAALNQALAALAEQPAAYERRCREVAVSEFGLERQASRYEVLFRELRARRCGSMRLA